MKLNLPPDFLIGAASTAHQVEGNNIYNNWWHEEQAGKLPVSGLAADHYNRFQEDFGLAKNIGLNAMRISLEWSRIEPRDGQWNYGEVEHYRTVLQDLNKKGLSRMVTLFHFTLPEWLAERGGMAGRHGVERFVRFSKFVAEQLGQEIDLWVTINEPEVFTFLSYGRGVHPPFARSYSQCFTVIHNLIRAHNQSYKAIKSVLPAALIGLAKNNTYYEPYRKRNVLDQLVAEIMRRFGNQYILDRTVKYSDFVGLNYYFYQTLQFNWRQGAVIKNDEGPKSDMGWRTFPQGLYYLLQDLRKYKLPVYITENGIANAHDDMRQRFIREHLEAVERARAEGVDVRGYFYWSLTDTYEWHDGYGPKFGLIEVNFETQERRVRPSADIFKP